jgi:hypothetical protein
MERVKDLLQRLRLANQAFRFGEVRWRPDIEMRPLTDQELADIQARFPMDKFFIFGHARSGTTLLARMVRLHPDVHCSWQAHTFSRHNFYSMLSPYHVRRWYARKSNRWGNGEDISPVILRLASDFILERDAINAGKTIVGDKSPNSRDNGKAVQRMHPIYPDGRVIFIVRDGRDAVLSQRFQFFIDLPHHMSPQGRQIRKDFARDPDPFFAGKRSLFPPGELDRAARNWVGNVEETERLGKELYGKNYLSLRFEDLIQEPFLTMQQVWSFLGVPPDQSGLSKRIARQLEQNPDAKWQEKKAGGMIDNFEKGKSGTWRELFTARDKTRFEDIASDTLHRWNYTD